MAKRLGTAFLAFALAISACGVVKGDAPARAGIRDAVPYDATHLDAGNVDHTGGANGAQGLTSDGSGPNLVP